MQLMLPRIYTLQSVHSKHSQPPSQDLHTVGGRAGRDRPASAFADELTA